MIRPLACFVLCALACLPLMPAAEAQQRGSPSRQGPKAPDKAAEKEPPPPPEAPPPPYDRDLMRLSEILGALAFLRSLCEATDAEEWPARMKAIIDAEGGTQARRDRLAGAYNRGYRSYAVTYRVCTPSAEEATTRFIGEGERLSLAISGRFGG